jgi:hypothetical protein
LPLAEIRAHESEASNLLKLNCKINNEIVGCLLNSIATISFMTPQVIERLGIKTKLMADPIMVQ